MTNVSKRARNANASAGKRKSEEGVKTPSIGAGPLIGAGLAFALLFAAFVAFTNRSAPPANIGGPFLLTTQNGENFSDRDLVGRPHLMFFGYTNCQDICHTTLFEMSEIMRALGPDANVGGVFVTVDPEHDTPQILKTYLESFDPRIVGLTGSRDAVDAMLKEFRIFSKQAAGDKNGYSVDHNTVVFLMDKEGRFVSVFNVARQPAEAARELKRYL